MGHRSYLSTVSLVFYIPNYLIPLSDVRLKRWRRRAPLGEKPVIIRDNSLLCGYMVIVFTFLFYQQFYRELR